MIETRETALIQMTQCKPYQRIMRYPSQQGKYKTGCEEWTSVS